MEAAALLRDPIWRGQSVPDADGQPVMLIPGFLAGDDSLGLMTRWLRRTGHHTRKAGMRFNVGCSVDALQHLEERLDTMAETRGQKVAVIGQSRGGNFAKVLAVRRPDLVSGIVTLGSAQLDPLAIHPLVHAQVYLVGALGCCAAANRQPQLAAKLLGAMENLRAEIGAGLLPSMAPALTQATRSATTALGAASFGSAFNAARKSATT